ncbi:MAG TPA: hypothetical protein VMG10_11245, partial [Gemmataceae bacterium]|nr:hypothetical protein [Gemmataceae bacterium]
WSALSNGTNISGATSTSLTLSSVTTAMSGYEYEAIFTNSAGTATSNVATLTVNSSSSSGLLSDGGFESPVLSPGSYVMDPSGTPWTFGGRAGIASNGSSVTGTLNAPQGTQVGFLSGFGSGFYQTVYLSTGTYYNLTFDAANVGRSQEIAVAVGGTILAEGTATSNQYTGYSTGAFYVTESGYYTVTFVGLNSRGGYALIDNVGLSATPAVKLSGSSSGALAQASLSGSSGLSGSSTSAVPASPGVASQSPLPSNHLSLNNTDLGWLTTLSSPTGPYFADQVFAQEQASMSGQLNSLFSAVFLSPLVTGLRSQATTDPFGEPLDWA